MRSFILVRLSAHGSLVSIVHPLAWTNKTIVLGWTVLGGYGVFYVSSLLFLGTLTWKYNWKYMLKHTFYLLNVYCIFIYYISHIIHYCASLCMEDGGRAELPFWPTHNCVIYNRNVTFHCFPAVWWQWEDCYPKIYWYFISYIHSSVTEINNTCSHGDCKQ